MNNFYLQKFLFTKIVTFGIINTVDTVWGHCKRGG